MRRFADASCRVARESPPGRENDHAAITFRCTAVKAFPAVLPDCRCAPHHGRDDFGIGARIEARALTHGARRAPMRVGRHRMSPGRAEISARAEARSGAGAFSGAEAASDPPTGDGYGPRSMASGTRRAGAEARRSLRPVRRKSIEQLRETPLDPAGRRTCRRSRPQVSRNGGMSC